MGMSRKGFSYCSGSFHQQNPVVSTDFPLLVRYPNGKPKKQPSVSAFRQWKTTFPKEKLFLLPPLQRWDRPPTPFLIAGPRIQSWDLNTFCTTSFTAKRSLLPRRGKFLALAPPPSPSANFSPLQRGRGRRRPERALWKNLAGRKF
jgi:hypothetical protein